MLAQSEFTINRSQIGFLYKIKIRLEFKGAVINYDREGGGGGEAFQKIIRKISNPHLSRR